MFSPCVTTIVCSPGCTGSVLARWYGGVNSYPAIVTRCHINEEKKVFNQKTQEVGGGALVMSALVGHV